MTGQKSQDQNISNAFEETIILHLLLKTLNQKVLHEKGSDPNGAEIRF
jgi:hypothetical protein